MCFELSDDHIVGFCLFMKKYLFVFTNTSLILVLLLLSDWFNLRTIHISMCIDFF